MKIESKPAAVANRPRVPIPRTPLGFVDHWMAGYLPGTTSLFQNPRTGYATNYGVGSDGRGNYRVDEYVHSGYAAWGNGNDHMNLVAISVEHENDRRGGPESKPTDETHQLSAELHASKAIEHNMRLSGKGPVRLVYFEGSDWPSTGRISPHFYGKRIPLFGVEYNVLPHRAMAKKDCPRTLDVPQIVAVANRIISGVAAEVEPIVKRAEIMSTTIIEHVVGKDRSFYQFEARAGIVPLGAGVDVNVALGAARQEKIHQVNGWDQFNMLNNMADAVRDGDREAAKRDVKAGKRPLISLA